MIIGIPKEIKDQEKRVGATPHTVASLISAGHEVIVEQNAGIGSGYPDEQYMEMGARIGTADDAWGTDMVIKVKEPLESEYRYFHKHLILYTYLHLAANKRLTEELLSSRVTGIGYETMEGKDGSLPLLFPMSEIAGRMSVQVGAHFLEQPQKGKGVLLAGVTGVNRGRVTIIGAGTVGFNALKMAVGLAAKVTILDINAQRLSEIDSIYNGKIQTLISNPYNIAESVKNADLVIGAVLIPGASAPKLVTEKMVKNMQPGSVIVDIPIDQGGIFETSTHPTTLSEPVYLKHGVIHYTVANMPGAVPRSSTDALTSATVRYAIDIANKGIDKAARDNRTILTGINTIDGKLTSKPVADSLNLQYDSFFV